MCARVSVREHEEGPEQAGTDAYTNKHVHTRITHARARVHVRVRVRVREHGRACA